MNNPMDAARCGEVKDAKSPIGTCQLMKPSVQLIPVRYGLVEQLTPTDIKLPYKTKAKPLGIRLLRDGWLYIIVEKKGETLLHEYVVKQGKISKLVWQGSEVASDVRTHSVGEAALIFAKKHTIYAAYSELQWTAVKCSQVIANEKDRQRFMQAINLAAADAMKGGKDLLTSQQANNWLAECAEKMTASEDQPTPYIWEHKPLYKAVDFASLSATVAMQYKEDHLYLILNDDIGVLRDLAEYQNKVAQWLEEWQSDEMRYQKYVEGGYIESQLLLTPQRIDSFAFAVGDTSFAKSLNSVQKSAVIDWLHELDEKYDDMARPTVGEKYRNMKAALGPDLMDKYEDVIHSVKEQYILQNRGGSLLNVSWGDWNAGKDGIRDLIHLDEMRQFLQQERTKLQGWHRMLDAITADRSALFIRFYFAAWYFDSTSSKQLREYLAAEYSCIKDLCWNDTASALVAGTLDKFPWISYPAVFTLSTDAYDKLTQKILDHINKIKSSLTAKESAQEFNNIGTSLNSLVSNEPARLKLTNLDDELKAFHQLTIDSYQPAMTLALADKTQELLHSMSQNLQFDPNSVLRNLNNAGWLELLKAYSVQGVTVTVASAAEATKFESLVTDVSKLRQENTRLSHQIRETFAQHRKKGNSGEPEGVKSLRQSHQAKQDKLSLLEPQIAQSMTPYGEQPGKIGYQIKGLTPEQRAEIKAMALDQQLKKSGKLQFRANGWDALAFMLTCFAVWNAAKTYNDSFDKQKDVSDLDVYRDLLGALGASFGLVQGIKATTNLSALKRVQSGAGKLQYGASLGRWTAGMGLLAYGFSGFFSGIKIVQALKKKELAENTGDTDARNRAIMELAAESGLTTVNGAGFIRTGIIVLSIWNDTRNIPKAMLWATNSGRLLSIGLRVNLIGIAISALQLGTTVIYNMNQRTDYQNWFEKSRWGKKPAFDSLQESNYQLAKLTAKPRANLIELTQGRALSVTLPGISLEQLDDAEVKLAAYWMTDAQSNDWQAYTAALEQQWRCLSEPGEPLQIALLIYPNETNANHGIALELNYRPMPDSNRRETVRFQTESFNRVGALRQVQLFKARNVSEANLRPLTTAQLSFK